jgi:N-acetylated-alpha-linked acidic dipeptidase
MGRSVLTAYSIALAAGVLLWPQTQQNLRGFDEPSTKIELRWEAQARAVPDARRIGDTIRRLSSRPHLAGTPAAKETAEYILALLRGFGLDAHIEQYEAVLPQPRERLLELTSPNHFRARLEEPPVTGDASTSNPEIVPTFNAYSADGDLTAPLVYVNYGVPADYAVLEQRGINVAGRIVIARYGNAFRGAKPKIAAEHGAVGCIIYSDPRDDGYFKGDSYPSGAFRPSEGVQRGSVLDITIHPGDPLSPGWPSEAGSRRIPIAEARTFSKIPVLPISAADAEPLLAALSGPVVPEPWRGALPLTYHFGGSGAIVHLRLTMDNATRPLYDVIADIPGSAESDQIVLFGNHHDAWVHGASDPVAALSAQLETARTLAELRRAGWSPRRSIRMGFWDGEEYGLIGATEYAEKHEDDLAQHLIAYLNSDSSGKGRLVTEGSHSLEALLREAARDVASPGSAKSLLDTWTPPENDRNTAFHLSPLGSGSDYTPFVQHLGIASLNLKFDSEDSGVYHSAYDDFAWYSRFSDTTFTHGQALAQLTATTVMRLADAPVAPFEFTALAGAISQYLGEIEALPRHPDLAAPRAALRAVARTAKLLDAVAPRALKASPATLVRLNQLIGTAERELTLDPGLPDRPWYRHRIYAPGFYTGYSVKTLPGIREAVEARRSDEAAAETARLEQVLRALDRRLSAAIQILESL